MSGPITAGALVRHTLWERGTVLDALGTNGTIYFPALETDIEGPRRLLRLDSPHLGLLEPSADPPETASRKFGVYVVELRDTAPLSARPDHRKPFLYVGVSQNAPSRRFGIHKEGGRTASKTVSRYGLWLRPDLYRSYPRVIGDFAASLLERQVAAELSGQGYSVDAGAVGFFWTRYQ